MGLINRFIAPTIKLLQTSGNMTISRPVRLPMSCVFDIRSNGHLFIGKGTSFRERVTFRVDCNATVVLGQDVFVNDGCEFNCHERIDIADGVMLGQNVLLYDHDHDYRQGPLAKRTSFVTSPITIGKNAWVGSNVVILKGVTIGENSVIAAGTIVNKDVPDNCIYYDRRESRTIDISEFNDAIHEKN